MSHGKQILEILCWFAGGGFLFWLGRHLQQKGKSLSAKCDRCEALLAAFEGNIKESATCCASIVQLLGAGARCECFRCRRQRGEDVTEESQAQAEAIQERAANALLRTL